jgi:hypothetical protein
MQVIWRVSYERHIVVHDLILSSERDFIWIAQIAYGIMG